jgi:DNA-binding Lrp family transcriptional regulator
LERTLKIHKELPEILVKDTTMLKSMGVFYSMKFLYVGGIIKDMTSRYGEIAERIGISPSNLRGKVKNLIGMGLVRKEGRNLLFAGHEEIGRAFKLKSKRGFRVSARNARELETVVKALALEVNFEKQRHRIREGIVSEELRRYGKIEAKGIRLKIRKYIRKNIGNYAKKYTERVSPKPRNPFETRKINTDITISRQGLADMVGRKSKSTGSRLIRRMGSLGLLESDSKRVERVCSKANGHVLKHLELDSSYFVFKGVLYKRKPNSVSLSSFFA